VNDNAAYLESLAVGGGPTTSVATNLTQAPQLGRGLFVAAGDDADAVAAEARQGGTLFRANIPTRLITQLVTQHLAEINTVNMGGVQGTEIHFYPAASYYVVRVFGQ
jgi:hypothetical protein